MNRRDILTMLGGVAFARALPTRAQKSAVPVVGFLGSSSAAQWAPFVAAFRKGLDETGFVEGKNVTIDFRWAEGQYDRLPALAVELVQRHVAVIVATGGAPLGPGREGGDLDHSDRVYNQWRPRRTGSDSQPWPAGRQHHGRELFHRRIGRQAPRTAA